MQHGFVQGYCKSITANGTVELYIGNIATNGFGGEQFHTISTRTEPLNIGLYNRRGQQTGPLQFQRQKLLKIHTVAQPKGILFTGRTFKLVSFPCTWVAKIFLRKPFVVTHTRIDLYYIYRLHHSHTNTNTHTHTDIPQM